ncbi:MULTISPECIES: hypothetical protein [Streptomyces]|jgi:hypothetical protein|uniref:Uncharacterized protein n=2 Tax=Streptomyces TaxID=1883 RepID=A0A514JSM7_9ACTN|nr:MULTISPECIES: hypothetical protein [Streptomyces]MBA8947780.1 hypothetical protein [Streptomyces calvus]MBA8974063.1 hypothetical protein [Streptomyces calvus]MYS31383.1 hypothetical protein [Streptomyces sp. SID7804]QDI70369.1 hypothetical protein CD934_17965 [Streptomyces calvus]GGP80362.1 hypothetical protein GCM10010247_62130 [Streptomyces calvus]
MNFASQVETAEISDADLDNVSGGHAIAAGVDAAVAVTTAGGSAGVGAYAEVGPLSVCAGLGGSVTPGGIAGDGHVHTTSA